MARGRENNTLFRVVRGRENPYAQVYKGLINDFRLGWDTRGMLTYLLSKPEGWEVRNSNLLVMGPAGDYALRRMVNEAIRYGYMHRTRQHGDDGRFEWVTLVFESPLLNPEYDPRVHGAPDLTPWPVEDVAAEPVEIPAIPPYRENRDMEEPPYRGFPIMDKPRHIVIKKKDSSNNEVVSLEDPIKHHHHSPLDKHDDDDDRPAARDERVSRERQKQASIMEAWAAVMITALWGAGGWNDAGLYLSRLSDDDLALLCRWLWKGSWDVAWFDNPDNPVGVGLIRHLVAKGQDPKLPPGQIDLMWDDIEGFADPAGALFGELDRGRTIDY
jgi:hypothetical protein